MWDVASYDCFGDINSVVDPCKSNGLPITTFYLNIKERDEWIRERYEPLIFLIN